ncbi:hypothetical protein ACQY0O_003392 [Thecaphora frezii]
MVSAKNASTVASRRKSPVAPTEHFRATVRRLDDILLATRGSDRRLKEAWPQLKGLHASLASGKTVTGAGEGRGLPMRIVVSHPSPANCRDAATVRKARVVGLPSHP